MRQEHFFFIEIEDTMPNQSYQSVQRDFLTEAVNYSPDKDQSNLAV